MTSKTQQHSREKYQLIEALKKANAMCSLIEELNTEASLSWEITFQTPNEPSLVKTTSLIKIQEDQLSIIYRSTSTSYGTTLWEWEGVIGENKSIIRTVEELEMFLGRGSLDTLEAIYEANLLFTFMESAKKEVFWLESHSRISLDSSEYFYNETANFMNMVSTPRKTIGNLTPFQKKIMLQKRYKENIFYRIGLVLFVALFIGLMTGFTTTSNVGVTLGLSSAYALTLLAVATKDFYGFDTLYSTPAFETLKKELLLIRD